MKFIIIFLFILSFHSVSTFSGTKEYTVGTGSEFSFIQKNADPVKLFIYFTESSFSKLGIEYYFSSSGFMPVEAWQQFHLSISDTGLALDQGYVLSKEMSAPEIMTKEFRENNDKGVKVEDFFFSNLSEIEKYKIGTEQIEVPAGKITTTHYLKKRENQNVNFWISDKAGSVGLVKLVSDGNANQTYTIELVSLLKNVKAKINPKIAVPLTDKGRAFLGNIKK
jgi:hypothetical protein